MLWFVLCADYAKSADMTSDSEFDSQALRDAKIAIRESVHSYLNFWWLINDFISIKLHCVK